MSDLMFTTTALTSAYVARSEATSRRYLVVKGSTLRTVGYRYAKAATWYTTEIGKDFSLSDLADMFASTPSAQRYESETRARAYGMAEVMDEQVVASEWNAHVAAEAHTIPARAAALGMEYRISDGSTRQVWIDSWTLSKIEEAEAALPAPPAAPEGFGTDEPVFTAEPESTPHGVDYAALYGEYERTPNVIALDTAPLINTIVEPSVTEAAPAAAEADQHEVLRKEAAYLLNLCGEPEAAAKVASYKTLRRLRRIIAGCKEQLGL